MTRNQYISNISLIVCHNLLILAYSSDIGPSQSLNLIPLHRMLQSHMVSDTVRMGEGFGAGGNGTGG